MSGAFFVCPKCQAAALAIGDCIDFEPDSRSDDITLQLVGCSRCGFEAVALYEESRRGSLDSEASCHTGYFVNGATLISIKDGIKACPAPRDGGCLCDWHSLLGARDARGAWDGLRRLGIDGAQRFAMTMAG